MNTCKENIMNVLVQLLKPIIMKSFNSCGTKELVCDLLDHYVDTTDNDVDDLIASTVRKALLRDCL